MRSQYKRMFGFAYIPATVINDVKVNSAIVQKDLLAYLCYAFEKAGHENVVLSEDYAVFAPGIQNDNRENLYCYFCLNPNQKQKWMLKMIDTKCILEELKNDISLPQQLDLVEEFSMKLYDYAYVPKGKYETIITHFRDNLDNTRKYIMHIFEAAHRYGYILYENNLAIFNTGLFSEGEEIFALFGANRNERQPWFLLDFMKKGDIRKITKFPGCATEEISANEDVRIVHEQNGRNSKKRTLIVTAIQKEYNALMEVIQERKYSFVERIIGDIGNRELRCIYIEEINTYAILAGKSFECIMPLVQCILSLKPDRVVLAGIAFSFDMQKAPFNSIVISEQVWDYESAKVNEADEIYWRGEKISASQELRRIFNGSVDKLHLIRNGVYASGMKLVNSVEFQDTMLAHQSELLAGDQEGYFFAYTCNYFRLDWIVIKAISDYGNKKDDSGQNVAAFTALSYVVSAIENNG